MFKLFAAAGLLMLLGAVTMPAAHAADVYTAASCAGVINTGPQTDAKGVTTPGTRCVYDPGLAPKD